MIILITKVDLLAAPTVEYILCKSVQILPLIRMVRSLTWPHIVCIDIFYPSVWPHHWRKATLRQGNKVGMERDAYLHYLSALVVLLVSESSYRIDHQICVCDHFPSRLISSGFIRYAEVIAGLRCDLFRNQ
jgi:hypothetical protein